MKKGKLHFIVYRCSKCAHCVSTMFIYFCVCLFYFIFLKWSFQWHFYRFHAESSNFHSHAFCLRFLWIFVFNFWYHVVAERSGNATCPRLWCTSSIVNLNASLKLSRRCFFKNKMPFYSHGGLVYLGKSKVHWYSYGDELYIKSSYTKVHVGNQLFLLVFIYIYIHRRFSTQVLGDIVINEFQIRPFLSKWTSNDNNSFSTWPIIRIMKGRFW